MFNDNAELSFITSPGDGRGTSIYRVCRNGTVRAKTATQAIHVRRGKNMYFLRNTNGDEVLKDIGQIGVYGVTAHGGHYALWLGPKAERGYSLVLEPRPTHQTPLDLYLKNNGRAETNHGIHVGHAIGSGFDGGRTRLSESQIRSRMEAVVAPDGLIRATLANGNYDMT